MHYEGRYDIFDTSRIHTYPLGERLSKVPASMMADPAELAMTPVESSNEEMRRLAEATLTSRAADRPVVWMTGAHLIKNGFGRLLGDLMERGLVSLVAMNMAGMIHDLELALVGRTSEDVPRELPAGRFGFAEETGRLLNRALTEGERLRIGAGEAIGRLICGEPMPDPIEFPHRHLSAVAAGWRAGVPVTMHAGIGTDIIDQHPNWDPAAKGGCSGRDFLIFAAEIERMGGGEGGVYLNVGTSVTGPEVFLKACSMAANVGRPPRGVVTASFDIRVGHPADVDDERKTGYYFRDLKSVVVRVPAAFGGRGYYIQGDHLVTLPAFYQHLVQGLGPVEPGKGRT